MRARLASAAMIVVAIFACGGSDEKKDSASSSSSSSGFGGSSASSSGSSNGGTSSGNNSNGSVPRVAYVNVSNETHTFAQATRSYILGKPKTYDEAKSYPLVIAFHGNPGTAEGMAVDLPFDSVSKNDAVIVYPQAATGDWDLYTPTDTNADMSWIRALVDEVKTKANIDKTKVYGFGYSGGGFFLTQFTCRFGGVFKAISVNAGGGPDEEQMGFSKRDNGCYVCPGGPVAILVTHGDSDGEVPPGSGEFTKNCYAVTNSCGDSSSDANAPCVSFDGCPEKHPVKWCLVPGLGHGIWGEAMNEAWAFFKALP